MKTDEGWVNVSECARLDDKSRKRVCDQISHYGIETQKDGNRPRLASLIVYRVEPLNGAPENSDTHNVREQKITHLVTLTMVEEIAIEIEREPGGREGSRL